MILLCLLLSFVWDGSLVMCFSRSFVVCFNVCEGGLQVCFWRSMFVFIVLLVCSAKFVELGAVSVCGFVVWTTCCLCCVFFVF